MNWGTKAVLGLATFMTFIIVLAVFMFNSDSDALVDNDYYEKGIGYNKDYNRKEQVNKDHAQPQLEMGPEMIKLTFKERAKGTVKLMRTSDKSLDRKITFETDTANQVIIPSSTLKKGSWRLIIDWVSNEKAYLYEKEITNKYSSAQ